MNDLRITKIDLDDVKNQINNSQFVVREPFSLYKFIEQYYSNNINKTQNVFFVKGNGNGHINFMKIGNKNYMNTQILYILKLKFKEYDFSKVKWILNNLKLDLEIETGVKFEIDDEKMGEFISECIYNSQKINKNQLKIGE